jgi:DNA adenine methylase
MLTSPLRYPGGKAKLYNFFTALIGSNNLYGSVYCEPYAGGAGLALRLLEDGFVDRVCINDIDVGIFAFWTAALHQNDEFCSLVEKTPVNISEWRKQKLVWQAKDIARPVELGFATYFLNRTNRSGIIDGAGPIGGYAQEGSWKINARFIKETQIKNIQKLGNWKSKIAISNLDAMNFFNQSSSISEALIYLDPPYYVKGRKLYANFYEPHHHAAIVKKLSSHRSVRWIVSYDDVPEIRALYSDFTPITYGLQYSAGRAGLGKEVMYVSDALIAPAMPELYAAE